MGSFKKAPDAAQVEDEYLSLVLVFLEGPTDHFIIARLWFPYEGEYLDFRIPEDGCGGSAVIREVKEKRKQGLTAFGIVDRDSLLSNGMEEAFWERDDAKFAQMYPFGPWVRVLRKWEIENYLLDPESYEMEKANWLSREMRTIEEAAQELLEHADSLCHLTAASILLNRSGISKDGGQDRNQDLESLRRNLKARLQEAGISEEELDTLVLQISGFREGLSSPEEEWDKLTRLIDGKATLRRLEMLDRPRTREDRRSALARNIFYANKIDPELQGVVEDFRRATPS